MDIKILDKFIASYKRKEDLTHTIYETGIRSGKPKGQRRQNIFTDDFREFGKSAEYSQKRITSRTGS